MATNLAYKNVFDTSRPSQTPERLVIQVSENKKPWVMTVKPDPGLIEIDTGLRADIRLTLPLSAGSKVPDKVAFLVESIKEFEGLRHDWDTYGANALDDRAVQGAMSLIIEAERTCCSPNEIVPLSSGGLGLRWSYDGVELEVDIDPDKTCSAYFEAGGDETELPRGSSLSKAMELVARFRRSR